MLLNDQSLYSLPNPYLLLNKLLLHYVEVTAVKSLMFPSFAVNLTFSSPSNLLLFSIKLIRQPPPPFLPPLPLDSPSLSVCVPHLPHHPEGDSDEKRLCLLPPFQSIISQLKKNKCIPEVKVER